MCENRVVALRAIRPSASDCPVSTSTTAEKIVSLFRKFSGDEDNDGNLFAPSVENPYKIFNVTSEPRMVVYCTKPDSAFRVFQKAIDAHEVTLLGRYGLPNERDLNWLLQTIYGRQCIFIGDADPQDVLVFTWLRTYFPLRWIGVSDAFLDSMKTFLTDNLTIELSRIEKEAAREIPALCPDFKELLGPNCGVLFDANKKLELEGAMNFAIINTGRWAPP